MELKDKVAVVTGAARGLGQEYAIGLARAGAAVVVADRIDTAETVGKIVEAGGRAIGATVDVADMATVSAMAEAAVEAFGRIDVLVNNAALYAGLKGGRFETLSEADWDACMAVNVKGVWNCAKACVPAMRKAGGGSIVNVSSIAATYGLPFVLHYTASKAAVIGLTRGLARELGRDKIRVNAVAPSAVMTEATRAFFGDKFEVAVERIARDQAIQQNLQTEDLLGTVLYLASDMSRFVTGQTLSVCGGTVFH